MKQDTNIRGWVLVHRVGDELPPHIGGRLALTKLIQVMSQIDEQGEKQDVDWTDDLNESDCTGHEFQCQKGTEATQDHWGDDGGLAAASPPA